MACPHCGSKRYGKHKTLPSGTDQFRCKERNCRQFFTIDGKAPPVGPGAKNRKLSVRHPLDPDLPVEEIVQIRKRQFAQLSAAEASRKIIPVKVPCDGPVGILHYGDPHVDDDGTDIAALERHALLVRDTEGLYAGNVGDTTNNWVGRLARLYGEQGTTARMAWKLAEWWMGLQQDKWLYVVGGNHDCHDMQTEALTRRGWLPYDEIQGDDQVLSIDPETGLCDWHPILSMIDRANDEEMVSIESRTVSACVTPNHRVLHRKRGWRKNWTGLQYGRADNLPARFSLPVSANIDRPEADVSDDWIALAGWLLTDGCIDVRQRGIPRVTFYQSKPDNGLEGILARLGLEHTMAVRDRDITSVCGRQLVNKPLPQREYRLTAEASRLVLKLVPAKGKLPEWAFALSARQFDVLLHALIAGDGSYPTSGSRDAAVLHGCKAFLDSVQAVAVSHGWGAFLSVARGKDYRLNLCRRQEWEADRAKVVSRAAPADRVWCLTVPLGNFMVRRNGKAHFSGNCWSGAGDPLNWITRQIDALYQSSEARLGLKLTGLDRQITVNVRHDFAGHSMWNPAHGVGRAIQQGMWDEIAICGHRHVSGYMILKSPTDGRVCHAIQVASYKLYDRYAREKGFRDQNVSPAVVTIINPKAKTEAGLITVHWDVDEAVQYLKWLRRKA